MKTSGVRNYGVGEVFSPGEPAKASSIILYEKQSVQFFAVLSGVFIWRATWGLAHLWFGDGYGSTIGSCVYGVVVCVCSRSVPWARALLASSPTTLRDKLLQQLLFVIVVSGTSQIWRGSWLIIDTFLSFNDGPMLALSLGIGVFCSSVINLTALKQLLCNDTVALVGG